MGSLFQGNVAVTKSHQRLNEIWNFFTRTTSGKLPELLTRKLCHATHPRILTRSVCACYKCVRRFYTEYTMLTDFSCKQLCWFPICACKKFKILSSRWWLFVTATSPIGHLELGLENNNMATLLKGCFTIRVHFQKLHSSPVLTIEAYFYFKVLLPKHWSGLGLPTAIKRRLESINFSKKYAHS